MNRPTPSRWRTAAVLAASIAAISCGGDNGPSSGSVKDYFVAVQASLGATPLQASHADKRLVISTRRASLNVQSVANLNATFHSGNVPSGTGGPTGSAQTGSTPLLGQPMRLDVSGSADFTKVYISVNGASGYWQLDLPNALPAVQLILTLAQNPPSASFAVNTTLSGSGGAGAAAATTIAPENLADADLAVTLKWTGPSDVDLHVFDPHENEVYFGNTTTADGGKLDLDSNAACEIDNINQETISWPKDKAPAGAYRVRVVYYDDCGQSSAPYTVTVMKKGVASAPLSGTFTGTAVLPGTQTNQSDDITTVTVP